jgi:cob(I)alamin adenosyltransferase
MVTLSRIVTRTGDGGETALGDGSRVSKDHPRIAVIGSVDELNAVLGLTLHHLADSAAALIRRVQNDLFDLGADLCVPAQPGDSPGAKLRINAGHVEGLEQAIDRLNADLPPLTSFVLPGGPPAAAWCHFARTVCRRAERDLVALGHAEPINPLALVYLNRLSDLLFVLARQSSGGHEPLWQPGG